MLATYNATTIQTTSKGTNVWMVKSKTHNLVTQFSAMWPMSRDNESRKDIFTNWKWSKLQRCTYL